METSPKKKEAEGGKTKKTKEDTWNYSKGQALLRQDVVSGRIPPSMDWQTVYSLYFRPEFAVGENAEEAKRLFEGRLKSARSRHQKNTGRAAEEERLMRADRLVHPPPATNFRGEPRWHGSLSQKIVKKDVADGFHLGKKPLEYYNLRPEFKNEGFPANAIAGHVTQEERTKKFLHQYRGRKHYS